MRSLYYFPQDWSPSVTETTSSVTGTEATEDKGTEDGGKEKKSLYSSLVVGFDEGAHHEILVKTPKGIQKS